ncbi:MAG: hypothetical protein OQL19_01260, partial [Gammaproteobacteria bacterium]|nr:hypothetical protein [Gammaproteobacteria bacterium]
NQLRLVEGRFGRILSSDSATYELKLPQSGFVQQLNIRKHEYWISTISYFSFLYYQILLILKDIFNIA